MIICLKDISQFLFVMENRCIFFDVQIEFLNIFRWVWIPILDILQAVC
jgi:hypothetical protein